MKRVVGLGVLVLVVATFPVLGDRAGAAAPETTTITSYVADFDIDDTGDLSATETITVNFPAGDKHGIFRTFDKRDPNAPGARRIPRHVHVTLDGEDAPFTRTSTRRYVTVRIGDPDVLLPPGDHTFEISYVIRHVLEKGTTGQDTQFYWNLIPGGWRQPIDKSRLTVHLPVPAEDVQCAVGAGEVGGCTAAGEGTRRLKVRTGALEPKTPVTVLVGLDIPTPRLDRAG